ncbi:DUF692 domain-containing protein [Archangium primigenium]|uniref:DUF692 domain-containing protein n=1 Tax=Melittangium TaxID=44 RepID=UPI00195E1F01|nr:DUF692 domain-containing protein [Archangium primigenium]MBM7115775.1 DUF692 domain-containing protein [Archangium primigenium]
MSASIQGIGLGLRRAFARELLSTERRVDWLEVTPENWLGFGGERARVLDACAERWPLVSHSVSLSLGGPDPLDTALLASLEALRQRTDFAWWSDHLCYSSAQGVQFQDLLPLPATQEAVEHVAHRVREAQARVDAPLLVENISYYAHMPGGHLDDAAFVRGVVERSGCGLLLDVNNVYVNALNHGFDPFACIDAMPLGSVRQLHLAGHSRQGGLVIDTHEGPIPDEVWALYRHTLRRAGRLIPTLVEWDQALPPLDEVLDELDRARAHAHAALGTREDAA